MMKADRISKGGNSEQKSRVLRIKCFINFYKHIYNV